MSKKINLAEVARIAGVSTATVSRVLNDYPFIRPDTRSRVLKVITETNYQLNAVARSLRRRKTYSVGVIISNVLSSFYAVIAKSVEDVAIQNGYTMILCNGGDDPAKELNYLKMLHENRVDGVILSPTGCNGEYLRYLKVSGIQVVLVDRTVEGMQCDAVVVNNRKASFLATSLLIEKGYGKVGFISGPIDRLTGKERMEGYREAHRENGMDVDDSIVFYGDFSRESGEEGARTLIEGGRIDALYAANLDMATGAYNVIMEKGLKIPEGLAFVMFDEPEWATLVSPQVTTVRQPVYEMGATAANMLMKRILEVGADADSEPEKVVLDAELCARESA